MSWKALSLKKIFVLLIALALLPLGPAALGEEVEIPKETLKALKAAVKTRIEKVWEEKVDGKHVRRGSSAMVFRPDGENRYKVEYYEDKVEKDDTLTRDRYYLSLVPDGKKWKIDGEELADSIKGLIRYNPGKEKYYRFGSFSFTSEGLTISGGAGTGYVAYRGDEPVYIFLVPENLQYAFDPPKDVEFYARHRVIKNTKKKDFEFTPESVEINCTPAKCKEFLETLVTDLTPTEKGAVHRLVTDDHEDSARDVEKYRKDNNFGGFGFQQDPDRIQYSVAVNKKNSKHYMGISYDNWSPREVGLHVYGMWPVVYRFHSEETRNSGISATVLERRPDIEARRFEVVSIDGTVELAVDDPESMSGDLNYVLKANRDGIEWLNFRITPNLRERNAKKTTKNPNVKVDFFQDADGNELTWIRTGSNGGRVMLPRAYKAGEPIPLRMKFANSGCIYNHSSTYSYVDRGGWLPFVRFGDLIDSLKLTIKVPERFKTLGIDKKVSEEVVDGINITRWESTHPVSFPTVIFGDYFEMESETVARKLDGTKIPVMIHFDKEAMQNSEILPRQLRPLLEQAAQSINIYTKVYGVEYPFTKLDLVNDPIGGFLYGQAPASIIYLADNDFRGAARLATNQGFDRADSTSISRFLKTVVAHETGHQWWGSSTANQNQGNYWFIESLAEYSSALYQEAVEGREAYLSQVEEWKRTIHNADLMYPIQSGYTEWAGEARGGAKAAIYNQGPFAFHILRETFGDKKFFNFLRVLAQSTAGKQIVTRDIQRLSEYAFGGSMDWFFDQWLRGVGLPQYRWDIKSRKTEDGQYLVEGKILQRVVMGKKQEVLESTYFRGAIPVMVAFKDGTEEKYPILVEGEVTDVRFKVPKQPKSIGFNAENEILEEGTIKGKKF